MRRITSSRNPLIKKLLSLQKKSSLRRKEKLFVIEGEREILLALEARYEFVYVFVCENLFKNKALLNSFSADKLIFVNQEVYSKIAYRDDSEGIIAIAKNKDLSLNKLVIDQNAPLLLVAENIEKPGNIGAMLRTADAAGVDAFVLVSPRSDIYNPNVIRASIGTVFSVQIAVSDFLEFANFIRSRNIRLFAATLQNSNPYYLEDYTGSCAIVVGSEAEGLTEQMRQLAHKEIIIPMRGRIDSMNVSVSAAILVYEAIRQRFFIS